MHPSVICVPWPKQQAQWISLSHMCITITISISTISISSIISSIISSSRLLCPLAEAAGSMDLGQRPLGPPGSRKGEQSSVADI